MAHSGKLISAAEDCIIAAVNNKREAFNDALEQLYSAYRAINVSMETMWGRSKPADYINFRFVHTLLGSIAYRRIHKVVYIRHRPEAGMCAQFLSC